MAIDLQKPEHEQGPGPQGNDAETQAQVDAIYEFAVGLKKQGLPDYQIKQQLQNKGLNAESADTVIHNINRMIAERMGDYSGRTQGGGSGIPSWAIWVGLLLLVNVLAAALDWGFFLY
ncbi:MAG: hypothetical protein AAF570_14040 [Bacteroidota bacterium]